MKKITLFLFVWTIVATAFAITETAKWKAHLSYNNTAKVVVTPHKVFALASGHVYSMTKEGNKMDTYTKVDGWSENSIADFEYNQHAAVLVCAYSNANIDLISLDGSVYNLPDLMNKNWSVDKTIYQIYNEGKYAYLACGFGVLVLDLEKKEIKDTYIIGPDAQKVPIYGFTADANNFYALSSNTIYCAPKLASNLLDFNVWQQNTIALPANVPLKGLYAVNDALLSVNDHTVVYQYKQQQWSVFYQGEAESVSVNISDNQVLVSGGDQGVVAYDFQLQPLKTYPVVSVHAAIDADNLWYAYKDYGLACLDKMGNQQVNRPSYLRISTMKELTIVDGRLLAAHGGYWIDRFGYPCHISGFEKNNWFTYTSTALQTEKWSDKVTDVTSIAIDPNNLDHFYFTTFGEGLFEVTDGVITQMYNETNTNGWLTSAIAGDDHYVRLDGLSYDVKGNLWLLNSYSSVNVLTPQGEQYKLAYPPLKDCPTLRRLLITSKHKWCVDLRYKPGIFVFSDKGTFADMADDDYRFFGSGSLVDKDGTILYPTYVYDIAEGTDGNVWVGTDLGPIVFSNVSKVFDSDYRCTRIKIAREDGSGLADYLLDGVAVMSLEVDAGNRKWLGTANAGVYLLSEDGQETLLHFNTENSPLSSNEVSDICIDQQTGDVYFVTPDGLFSYRGDAMQAVDVATQETIYAFPNPVRPEYGGDITIAGLEQNSKVWITDASANVVFEGTSNGGSLVWDGRNKSGQMVSGGVYFVLVSNANSVNHRSVATKILIVR